MKILRNTCLLVSSLTLLTSVPVQAAPIAVTPDGAPQIGAEAFIYTYPLVPTDITRHVSINFDADAPPASYWE